MRNLVRLVLDSIFLEIMSRFCATLSAIGCTYVSIHIYIYTYIVLDMYMYIYVYTYAYIYIHRCTHSYVNFFVHIHMIASIRCVRFFALFLLFLSFLCPPSLTFSLFIFVIFVFFVSSVPHVLSFSITFSLFPSLSLFLDFVLSFAFSCSCRF